MITINDITIINCNVGISAPVTTNMSINGAYFKNVGTCYELRNDHHTRNIKGSNLKSFYKPKNFNHSKLYLEVKNIMNRLAR